MTFGRKFVPTEGGENQSFWLSTPNPGRGLAAIKHFLIKCRKFDGASTNLDNLRVTLTVRSLAERSGKKAQL